MPKGEYLQYGGQAVVEGVMMRSPRFFAVACRAPNGEIIIQQEALEKSWIGRQKWLRAPFLRGSFALIDAMSLGNKALKFASEVQIDAKYQPIEEGAEPIAPVAEEDKKPNRIQDAAIGSTLVFGIVFGLVLFVLLPNVLADWVLGSKNSTVASNGMTTNLVAGLIKIVIFMGYLALIGQMDGIKEVFKYHGAEHKAINALEADLPLETDICIVQTRFHPRCGTSFAIIVLIIGLVIFTFIPRYPLTGHPGNPFKDASFRFLVELCILPIIAGISYELLRFAGKFRNEAIVSFFFLPGIWSQRLTTREPEAKHVEVAVAALRAVMDAENNAPKV